MGSYLSPEQARRHIRVALDAVDAAHETLRQTDSDLVGNAFRVEMADRLETQHRTNRGLSYRTFGELFDPPDGPEDPKLPPGVKLRNLLWSRLRIPPGEIRRRVALAVRIRPRRSLTGPALPAELENLSAAVKEGAVGDDHIKEVCNALDRLPSVVSADDRAEAQRMVVEHATKYDAKIVAAVGRRIAEVLNPDGIFDENDRARRRGVHLGPQGPDGMSRLTGWLDPETRSYLEAVEAAVRPGHHVPDTPDADEGQDTRSAAQRCHDALKFGLRAGIASGDVGTHRGVPVTVIATTTAAELDQALHAVNDPSIPMPPPARTGGTGYLPMRDLIRMAAGSVHYLAVFDDHSGRPLYLGRSKRIASLDQRIICYARDRGCTRPNCLEPGYHCEVHHAPDWGRDGETNADQLFFACGPDHGQVTKGEASTEVTDNGRLGWSFGTGPPEINHAHHPDELLHPPPQDHPPPEGIEEE